MYGKNVRAAVIEHLDINILIYNTQFRFRNRRSCVLQLLDVLEGWTHYVECDENWDTMYLDFAKAFDSVPHQRLHRNVISNLYIARLILF